MSFINDRLDNQIWKHGRENLDYFLENKDEDEQDEWLSEEALHSGGPGGDFTTHHFLYNEDYFKTDSGDAEDFLGEDTFDVIRAVKEWEEFNFGEVNTDFSNSVEVANLYAYIRGQELMDDLASAYKRDRITNRKRFDRNNNKMFDSGNDFKFRQ